MSALLSRTVFGGLADDGLFASSIESGGIFSSLPVDPPQQPISSNVARAIRRRRRARPSQAPDTILGTISNNRISSDPVGEANPRTTMQNNEAFDAFESNLGFGQLILQYSSPGDLLAIFDRLRRMVQRGKKLLLERSGVYVTITDANLDKTKSALMQGLYGFEDDEYTTSDAWQQFIEADTGTITIVDADTLKGGSVSRYVFRSGAFFNFTHSYDCAHLKGVLSRYGCFNNVDPSNYRHNCLTIACEQAGAPQKMLDHVKSVCIKAHIPVSKLKDIAIANGVVISVRFPQKETSKRKNKLDYYGGSPKDGKTVIPLALIESHYIIDEKTSINRWALENYETVKHLREWWRLNGKYRSDNDKLKLSSYELLQLIEKTPITAEDSRIFETFEHSLAKNIDDACLDYPPCAVQPFHKNDRNVEFVEKVCFDIETSTRMHDDPIRNIELMKERIHQTGYGESILHRALCDIDETNIREVTRRLSAECPHTPYLLSYTDDGVIKSIVHPHCGKMLLNRLALKHGINTLSLPKSDFEIPISKLSYKTIHQPLKCYGKHYCEVSIPANVYSAASKLTVSDLQKLKPDWTADKADSQFKALAKVLALPKRRIGDSYKVIETYTYSSDKFEGRLYSGGICGLFGALRSNLMGDVWDIDQSACCHRIISWICREFGIACPRLDEYVKDRKGFLQRVAEQDGTNVKLAKTQLILIYMWDKKLNNFKSDELQLLSAEAYSIRQQLSKIPELQWILNAADGKTNRLGSFMSRLFQHIEAKLTLACSMRLSELGVKTSVLMFDGFSVSKNHGLSLEEVIQTCEQESERLCPGLGMVWTCKDLDFRVFNKREEPCGELDLRESPFDEDAGKKEKVKIPTVLLIAHSATYDYQILMKHLFQIRFINKGTSLVCGSALYTHFGKDSDYTIRIEFKDSWKLLPMPLREFKDAFSLDVKKEVMPHNWYTESNVACGLATLEELRKYAGDDYDELVKNLDSFDCRVDDKYDMLKYSQWYCEQDVRVLQAGYEVFRSCMIEATKLDIDAFPTLAGVADMHMYKSGVYKGVYELSAIVQQFISRASVGGRVMCRDNKRSISKNMADYDATSLYPSAMVRLGGFLKGAPKVWNESVDLSTVDGYFVEIKVISVGRDLPFPVTCLKRDGMNDWTNRLEGHSIIVDKFTLEDLVRHQKITYTIKRGYYFDEGRNNMLATVMKDMFEKRLYYKDKTRFPDGNPLQLIFKLLMNTSYGICGLKPIDSDVSYVSRERYPKFLDRNYNRIKSFTKIGWSQYRFELYKSLNQSFNRIHCACEVLSMSKTIMNEVFVLAEDEKIYVTYQDTDSGHFPFDRVIDLDTAFEKKYGRKLTGKGLGQFHVDFDYGDCFALRDGRLVRNTTPSVGDIKAVRSIIVGKKTYLDELEDSAGNRAYHARSKGISHSVLVDTVNHDYKGDIAALFTDLHDGIGVLFDFNICNNVVFKRRADHCTYTTQLKRRLQFPVD